MDYSGGAFTESAPAIERTIISKFLKLHYFLRYRSHAYFFIMERSKPFLYKHFLNVRNKNPEYWLPLDTETPTFRRCLDSTVEKISEMNKLVKKDGRRFTVVIFPYEIQLSQHHVELYEKAFRLTIYQDAPKAVTQSLLTEQFARLGIEWIDLLEPYRQYAQKNPDTPLFIRSIVGAIDWMHPNEIGHEIAVKTIASRIIDGNRLLNAQP